MRSDKNGHYTTNSWVNYRFHVDRKHKDMSQSATDNVVSTASLLVESH